MSAKVFFVGHFLLFRTVKLWKNKCCFILVKMINDKIVASQYSNRIWTETPVACFSFLEQSMTQAFLLKNGTYIA